MEAAKKLGVRQPRIAELNHIAVDKFSTDLLIKYLYIEEIREGGGSGSS